MHPELLDDHIDRVARELTMPISHSRLGDDVQWRIQENPARVARHRLVAATAVGALLAFVMVFWPLGTSERFNNPAATELLAGRSVGALESLVPAVHHEPVTIAHDTMGPTARADAGMLLVQPLEVMPLSVQATEIQALEIEEIRVNDIPAGEKELK